MGFWTKVFAAGGEQSWGRVAASVALAFGCVWITRLVWLFTVPDQYERLYPLAAFVIAVGSFIGSLYWISKRYETMQSIQSNKSTSEPEAQPK